MRTGTNRGDPAARMRVAPAAYRDGRAGPPDRHVTAITARVPLPVHAAALALYALAGLAGLAAAAAGAVTDGAAGTADGLPRVVADGGIPAVAGLGAGAVCAVIAGRLLQIGVGWARLAVLGLSALSVPAAVWRAVTGQAAALTAAQLTVAAALLTLLSLSPARRWCRRRPLP